MGGCPSCFVVCSLRVRPLELLCIPKDFPSVNSIKIVTEASNPCWRANLDEIRLKKKVENSSFENFEGLLDAPAEVAASEIIRFSQLLPFARIIVWFFPVLPILYRRNRLGSPLFTEWSFVLFWLLSGKYLMALFALCSLVMMLCRVLFYFCYCILLMCYRWEPLQAIQFQSANISPNPIFKNPNYHFAYEIGHASPKIFS